MAATLGFDFREHWRDLKRGRPGRRFQARYERARQKAHGSGFGKRIVLIAVAIVCLAIGVVLSVMPGPAVLFFFLAGGLLATESRFIARFMDWCEVQLRRAFAWAKRRWRSWGTFGRMVAIVVGVITLALLGFVALRLLRG